MPGRQAFEYLLSSARLGMRAGILVPGHPYGYMVGHFGARAPPFGHSGGHFGILVSGCRLGTQVGNLVNGAHLGIWMGILVPGNPFEYVGGHFGAQAPIWALGQVFW